MFPVNLSKFLSSNGVAARRKASEIIKSGVVTVNGEVVIAPGTKVYANDVVTVNGKPVVEHERVYIVLYKPAGYTCTSQDVYAKTKAIDLIKLPEAQQHLRLFSAGRLDNLSEGMLIFSNDGDYVAKLTHPSNGICKEYLVQTDRNISLEKLQDLRGGIYDDGEFLKPVAIEPIANNIYRFILNEGKKREIRRMVSYADAQTLRLKRDAIGLLRLDIKPGEWRYLTEEDCQKSLRNS